MLAWGSARSLLDEMNFSALSVEIKMVRKTSYRRIRGSFRCSRRPIEKQGASDGDKFAFELRVLSIIKRTLGDEIDWPAVNQDKWPDLAAQRKLTAKCDLLANQCAPIIVGASGKFD